MAEPILSVQRVSKTFGGLRAVQDVSFDVPAGSLTALIGPNGAGKTTLFALMSGFLRPDSGHVRFAGQDITGQAPDANARLGMARTFQIVQPFAAQTVRENIAVGAHLHERRRAAALDLAEAVAERVGLTSQLDKPAADLTVAGRKRLELARALATQPRLLLLDEVLAGLNPQEIGEMIPVVQRHCRQRRDGADDRARDAGRDEPGPACVGAGAGAADRRGHARAKSPRNERVIEAYLGHGTAARLRAEGDRRAEASA